MINVFEIVSGIYWLGDVGKETRNLAFPGPDEECLCDSE